MILIDSYIEAIICVPEIRISLFLPVENESLYPVPLDTAVVLNSTLNIFVSKVKGLGKSSPYIQTGTSSPIGDAISYSCI